MAKKSLALWDMDGTLSNDAHRQALYVPGIASDYWLPENMAKDALYPEALAGVQDHIDHEWQIGILTARLESYNRECTEEWLRINLPGFDFDPIILRPDELAWMRPPEFKLGVVRQLLASGEFETVVLHDNDPYVISAIHKNISEVHAVHRTWDLKGLAGG